MQKIVKSSPYPIKEGPNGGILVTLNYEKDGSESATPCDYTPEQILPMLLVNLK